MGENNERTFAGYRRALRSRNRSEQTIASCARAIRELDSFLSGADVAEGVGCRRYGGMVALATGATKGKAPG